MIQCVDSVSNVDIFHEIVGIQQKRIGGEEMVLQKSVKIYTLFQNDFVSCVVQ